MTDAGANQPELPGTTSMRNADLRGSRIGDSDNARGRQLYPFDDDSGDDGEPSDEEHGGGLNDLDEEGGDGDGDGAGDERWHQKHADELQKMYEEVDGKIARFAQAHTVDVEDVRRSFRQHWPGSDSDSGSEDEGAGATKPKPWHLKHAKKIQRMREDVDEKIARFAAKRGITPDVVRRNLRLHRPASRGGQAWNTFQEYIKAHPGVLEEWKAANPGRATITEHYKGLSDADKQKINDWKKTVSVVGPVKDMQKGVDIAYRKLTKLVGDLQEDYNVTLIALLTHPDPDIGARMTGSSDGNAAFKKAIKRINPGFDDVRFMSIWDGNVSGEPSAEHTDILTRVCAAREEDIEAIEASNAANKRARIDGGDGDSDPRSGSEKRAGAAQRLQVYLQALVSAYGTEPGASKWAARNRGSRGPICYAGFFTGLQAAGLKVKGWPHECETMLSGGTDWAPMTEAPGSALEILSGGLLGTQHWRQPAIEALAAAMDNNEMVVTSTAGGSSSAAPAGGADAGVGGTDGVGRVI